MKRLVSPVLNPAGLMATAGTVYAAAVMIWNATHHHGVINPEVIVAAIGAVAALLTRQVVTPVADPRDGNGDALSAKPVLVLPDHLTPAELDAARDLIAEASGRMEQTAADERKITVAQMVPPSTGATPP